jgi:enterochelin esterase family protein
MQNTHCFILMAFMAALPIVAQTNQQPSVVSPEVHADHRVTFRLRAPKASEASLWGDWMPVSKSEKMSRDDSGVWSITTGPLEAGIAIYNFKLDGLDIADPVNPRLKVRARTSASLVEIPANPPALWEARPVPHGKIEINWQSSTNTGDTRAFYVYIPPQYSEKTGRRFPVLYLLHGNNDTAAGWTDVGKANFILDNLIAEHKAEPMIIVMPWGHAVPFGAGRSDNTVVFERYLLDEVIPQVEKRYRVAKGREHRALFGLSMGGGQTLQIGFRHLDVFSALASFSGAVPNDFESRFRKELQNPAATNRKLKLLWMGCGKQDDLFNRTVQLDEILKAHQIKHTFVSMEGRHNYAVWRKCLAQTVPLLFRNN